MKRVSVILICLLFVSNVFAQELVDLGQIGAACKEGVITEKQKETKVNLSRYNNVDVSFFPQMIADQNNQNSYVFALKPFDRSLDNKTFFIFGADTIDMEKIKNIKADYGICIKYGSASDVSRFIKDAGLKFPVLLGNNDIVSLFKISRYPALAIIKNGTVTVETDF